MLAPWWRRAVATIIDGLILGIITLAIGVSADPRGREGIFVLLGLVYTVALLGIRGYTVGQIAVHTAVVSVGGEKIGYLSAALRYIVQTALSVTAIGGLLDILWPLWDRRNQTLHDKAASTLVVLR